MDTFLQDVRYAVRALRASPGFAAVAILTLALGIGANTAIFSVVNRLLFHPYPFLESDRLTAVWAVGPRGNDHNEVSPADFRDWQSQSHAFDHLVAHGWWTANISGGDQPERVQGFRVSPDYFEALGVRPMLGRSFAAGEDEPGKDRLVILSYGLWQRRFASNPAILGTTLSINGIPRVVIGVMPRGVRYPAPAEAWAPLSYSPQDWARRQSHFLLVTGRLAPGATLEGARNEMAAIGARLAAQYPETNTGWRTNIRPLVPDSIRQLKPMLLVLFGAVGFVLLIACANVANLMLARASGRRRELAVRMALGAARNRITRMMLTESLVLALVGGLAAVLVGIWGTDVLVALVPPQHQRFLAGFDQVRVDGPVLAFTATLAVLSSVIFGLVPALRASRADANEPLRGGAVAGGRERHRLRRTLVGAEVALALLLLVGAGLTWRTFNYLGNVQPGFDGDHVALTALSLPGRVYSSDTAVARFTSNLLERAALLPGVTAAGVTNVVPLCSCNETGSFGIVGAPPFPRGEEPDVGYRVVSSGYFDALRIPFKQGRNFTAGDDQRGAPVVIVNETLSRRWFPNGGALGRSLYLGSDSTQKATVVGIVGDVRHNGLASPLDPEMFVAVSQRPNTDMILAVRTAGDASVLLPSLRQIVQELDHDLPVYDQQTMRAVMDLAVGPYRFSMRLLTMLGFVALILAGIGIYGVIAHLVAERTREIGIRMALGGDQASVRRLVVGQGMLPALIGLGVGLVGALALTQVLASQMVGVSPRDPLTFGGVALLLLGVALAACWVPARRASRVDPMVALRSD